MSESNLDMEAIAAAISESEKSREEAKVKEEELDPDVVAGLFSDKSRSLSINSLSGSKSPSINLDSIFSSQSHSLNLDSVVFDSQEK